MILYHAPPSYYSMVARLALLEAGIGFEGRLMDLHIAKQQLAPWYQAINPHMTVPALVDGDATLVDSQDILRLASARAGSAWLDRDPAVADQIEAVVQAFYAIPIENLTFTKAMSKIPPLRLIFPRVLGKIVKTLKAELSTSKDPDAVLAKIAINEQRIAYFTQGSLTEKLNAERAHVSEFLKSVPVASPLLCGDRVSSADIVCAVLLGRLSMIGEQALVKPVPELHAWFERFQARPAFALADIWLKPHLIRLLLRR
jgi:glutathione S-transferase